jgi:hypothetical protein
MNCRAASRQAACRASRSAGDPAFEQRRDGEHIRAGEITRHVRAGNGADEHDPIVYATLFREPCEICRIVAHAFILAIRPADQRNRIR